MSITSGVYTRYGGDDRCQQESATPPHEVNSANMDAEFNDFAGAINQTFFRDGSAAATGNWDMGGYNISNIGTISDNVTASGVWSFTSGANFGFGTYFFNAATAVVFDSGFTSYGLATFDNAAVFNSTVVINGPLGFVNLNNNPVFFGDAHFDDEISFNGLVIPNHTPASSSEAGTQWKITTDEDYLYLWTAGSIVKRIPWNSF